MMKIKTDFVTNSSSTGFIFCFKDKEPTKELLIEMIAKYSHHFYISFDPDYGIEPREYDVIDIDAEQFIEKLKTVDMYPNELEGSPFITDDESLKTVDDLIDSYEENVLTWIKNKIHNWVKDNYTDDWVNDNHDENEQLEKYSKLYRLKNKGFTGIIDISIGDNEGHIFGDDFATAMDYGGRHLLIEEEDFALITELRR